MAFSGKSETGQTVTYTDGKRYLYFMSVFWPLVPTLSVLAYFYAGHNVFTTLLPVLFVFGLVPLVDAILGEDQNNPPEEVVDDMANDQFYRYLVLGSVPLFWISFLSTAYLVGTQDLPWWSVLALVIGVGTTDGSCLTNAHELGHKHSPVDRFFAKLSCAVCGYAHFCIEHNRGHHVWVSTPEDPASSRMGESIYHFASRELLGTFRRGWEQEALLLSKRGKSVWSWENDILQGYAITFIAAAVLVALLGWTVLPFIIGHHFVGWYGLTQANYVEHYGLLRQKRDNGRYEPVAPRHSWNTNHIFSNLITFHLQRHSDHHANPQRPYQSLRDFPDLPRLPSGYPGMYLLAAIPPLWFRVMDPKVMAWAGGDFSKINVHAPALADLQTSYGATANAA
ncbi:MAG: alkane 1-monooxygenase [Micropepsaceae bacterium]